MARITLVNPAPVLKEKLDLETRQKTWPPLGLLYLGEILRCAGHDIKIIDQEVTAYSAEKIVEMIKKRNTQILGLSPLTISLESALDIAKLAKEWNENLIVVFGNVLATLVPQQLLKRYDFIDYCLGGECESTFLEFVHLVEQEKTFFDVKGLSYRKNGLLKTNPLPPLNRNLDALPFPDREVLIDFDYRMGANKFTLLATSRGCPYKCIFCGIHLVANSQGIWRPRSIDNVIKELVFLQSKGYKEFSFVDDCFTVQRKRTIRLCHAMKEAKIDMIWSCEGRIDQGTREVLRTMRVANCYNILLGIESANQRILNYYRKQITPEMTQKVVKNVKKAGIENVAGLFVVGAPDETIQEIIHTLKFGLKLDLTFLQFQLLHVLLGSDLWKQAIASGLINAETDWNRYIIAADIYPTAVKRAIIEKLIDRAFVDFLASPKFFLKEIFRTVRSSYRLQNLFSMMKRPS
ncbi:MAG: B12-binding domain-containing radical SAM protein [Candidatus Helarchaeota archaeon]